jgi:mono/diheme cytochrome c family protein
VHKYSILIFMFSGLLACSDQASQEARQQSAQVNAMQVVRNQDAAQIQRGRKLFSQNCMVCHGSNAEGAPNWNQVGADGKYPAPPLNGSGHAWHHPKQALVNTIKFGTIRLGGNMPAWTDKLSDQEIHDIIAWFQSHWPDELYAAWQRKDQAAQQSRM